MNSHKYLSKMHGKLWNMQRWIKIKSILLHIRDGMITSYFGEIKKRLKEFKWKMRLIL